MHEEPLHLIPVEYRAGRARDAQRRGRRPRLPRHHRGRPLPVLPPDVQRADGRSTTATGRKVLDDIRVRRLILSEQDRVGIGTFQPKDEKNQDATELTGDINYRKIAEYGTESDPRAFNFDGEFNIANRGIIEFIEVLKLDVAFLYDLLGPARSTRSSPRSSPRPTSTRSSSGTPTSPSTRSSSPTSSWRPCGTGRSRSTSRTSPGSPTRSRSTRRTTTAGRSAARRSPRTRSKSPRCGPSSPGWRSPRTPA